MPAAPQALSAPFVPDNFDPRIVDGLAATRPMIAFDYRGVGASGGKAPLTVPEMAEDAIAFIRLVLVHAPVGSPRRMQFQGSLDQAPLPR